MEKQSTGSTSDEGRKYEQMAYTSLQKKDFKEAETNFLTALQHIGLYSRQPRQYLFSAP
jgi:hypothetical protein